MTMTVDPQPTNDPPRVRLEMATPAGGSFVDLAVTRAGAPLRAQPYIGGAEALLDDYEAPFGLPVTYTAKGTYIPASTPDWSETWASLAAWTGDTGSWSVSSGEATSLIRNAQITRGVSGAIQRIIVTNPTLVRVELLSADEVTVIASLQTDLAKVSLRGTGTSPLQATGGGSYSLVLDNGYVTAAALDGSWSLTRDIIGDATKVRLVALDWQFAADTEPPSFVNATAIHVDSSDDVWIVDGENDTLYRFSGGSLVDSWACPANVSDLTTDSAGNVYFTDRVAELVRKYTSAGVAGTTWSTTGRPLLIVCDSSDNLFVYDADNKRVRKYSTTGIGSTSWYPNGEALGLAMDPTNGFLTAWTGDYFMRYDTTGALQSQLAVVPNEVDWNAFEPAPGLAVTAEGSFVIHDPATDRIKRYDSNGILRTSISAPEPSSPVFLGGVDSTGVLHFTTATVHHMYVPLPASVGAIAPALAVSPTAFAESATITLDVDEPWLIHPSQPDLSLSIGSDTTFMEASTRAQTKSEARRTIHEPIGRRRRVVTTTGPRAAEEWVLSILSMTLDARADLLALLDDQTPLLLRMPAGSTEEDVPDGWYSVGDLTVDRMPNAEWRPIRELNLPMTPVDEPIVTPGSDWTWADVAMDFTTWASLLPPAGYDAWIDTLAGPPDA